MDVKMVFMNGTIDEEVHIVLPWDLKSKIERLLFVG